MVALANTEGIELAVTNCPYYVAVASVQSETVKKRPVTPSYEEKVAEVEETTAKTKKQSLGEFLGG